MRIQRLTRASNGVRTVVDSLVADERLGIVGDEKSEKDGSVSLLAGEAERWIRGLGGLCTEKFAANLVTSGLDYASLAAGMRLIAGETELLITRVGKSCYEACAFAEKGEPCLLQSSCAFARIVRGGTIRTHDEMTICT